MNFKHLYYFWITARTGGVVRAGKQLHVTPQTLSGQIKLLEERLGCRLLERNGRHVQLTDAGRVAAGYAEEIFLLGSQLECALKESAGTPAAQTFHVGVADAIPKAIAYRLLEPAIAERPTARIVCREGGLPALLADLATQRLDLVLSDAPPPADPNVNARCRRLGGSGVKIFAAAGLHRQRTTPFPECLNGMPMLMPGKTSALRAKLDDWLSANGFAPDIVGEFDDWALMTTFGREGRGVFAAPSVLETQLMQEHGVHPLGSIGELSETFYAISIERARSHPFVNCIADAARAEPFGSP
jgi:LysR family transcriptional activator of nhaA